jgi:hypothetical protein
MSFDVLGVPDELDPPGMVGVLGVKPPVLGAIGEWDPLDAPDLAMPRSAASVSPPDWIDFLEQPWLIKKTPARMTRLTVVIRLLIECTPMG